MADTITIGLRSTVWGRLPQRIKALYISTRHRPGRWLSEALASDNATEVLLQESLGASDGLARLREEVFDLVLVSHEPGLDALQLIEGLRAAGAVEPILILGSEPEDELAPLAYEVGADAYLCVANTTTRTLLWVAARAIERHQLMDENRRLHQAQQQRLQQEHLEADRLLAEQRSLIVDIEALSKPDPQGAPGGPRLADGCRHPSETGQQAFTLPAQLVAHYREILRAYVIMGSGNIGLEMERLADIFASTGVSAQQAMLVHVQVLEELIRGLGNRSARHVMTRADLLALELMVHLAEGYRRGAFSKWQAPGD